MSPSAAKLGDELRIVGFSRRDESACFQQKDIAILYCGNRGLGSWARYNSAKSHRPADLFLSRGKSAPPDFSERSGSGLPFGPAQMAEHR